MKRIITRSKGDDSETERERERERERETLDSDCFLESTADADPPSSPFRNGWDNTVFGVVEAYE